MQSNTVSAILGRSKGVPPAITLLSRSSLMSAKWLEWGSVLCAAELKFEAANATTAGSDCVRY